MTDNEIIKALEHCKVSNCLGCPCHSRDENCLDLLTPKALDLINRQKAEIERLRNTVKTDFLTVTEKLKLSQFEIGDIRAEAIKEFAERLCEGRVSNDPVVIAVKVELEMTEQRKDEGI